MRSSWFYPQPTGDPGVDRNARTLQFTCVLLALAVGVVLIVSSIDQEWQEVPLLLFAIGGFVFTAIMNRAGRSDWAGRTAFLVVLLAAIVLVFRAHDGFRSHSMLLFPGLLLISLMMLNRASYVTTAAIIVVTVGALGIAVKYGLTRATPPVHTSLDSIFYVDLNLLVIAIIGSRIASDTQTNIFDLRSNVKRLSDTNLELREAADALRENEQQLVSIYNAVRDVIFYLAVEPEGRFRFNSVNAAFLRITGLSQDMVVGRTVNEVIPAPSLPMVLRRYRQAIEEHTTVVWEETSDYPNGRLTGEVSVTPVFDSKGICTHLVGSVHDMTEHKRDVAALRDSEERLKNAERLAHVGSWRWDLESNEVGWSEELFHIFGQRPDYTPTYEGMLQAVVLQDRERMVREIRDAIADQSSFSSEVQIARVNGDLRTLTCLGEVLLDENGPVSFLGACQDITELRRVQRVDFARQKLESIGTLASGIAHDFNNLLGSILIQAEVALRGLTAGSKPDEELKTIRDVAVRGSEIVRELMIYAGKDTAVVGLVNVSQVLNEMLELIKISVSKHAQLDVNLGHHLPFVRANAAQLQQIVMNLVTNASDALGDQDGVIRLTTKCVKVDEQSETICESLEASDYLQLEVSDTGCGIPPETQAKMFDPFFTTKSAGHGLGLAMVDGIVRGLRGKIELTSQPGKGTTFQILLPCTETDMAVETDAFSRIEGLGRPFEGATVLIVEDEDPLRQAVTKMLRQSGFEVFEVGDGSSAIDLLRVNENKIDLILLDMTIPGASSAQVIDEAAKVRPDIRVVLTSAYSEQMVMGAVSAPQVRSFIRKPFHLAHLVKTLTDTLSM